MITSKKDYKEYLASDKIALGKKDLKRPRFKHDIVWKYQILMRKAEYYQNCRHDLLGKIISKFTKLRFVSLGQKLGFSIPLNVFGKGLSIAHYGTIVINSNAKVGEFCRIHEGVTIGVSADAYWGSQDDGSSKIGDRVFIGSGAKIIGNVKIADDVAIGAGAVVVKDISESSTTWAGVPAKKISDNGSEKYILCENNGGRC